jgi:hypothetical protein
MIGVDEGFIVLRGDAESCRGWEKAVSAMSTREVLLSEDTGGMSVDDMVGVFEFDSDKARFVLPLRLPVFLEVEGSM